MGGSHDYEVTVIYGALIDVVGGYLIGGFSGVERLVLVEDRTEIRQRAAPQSQLSPPMIWCEHALGLDSCAERENFS